jgi:Cu/Ag efflux pump CusA
MIPIAPTIFWGPMAYAIMGGLAIATLLTLVFLPALYVVWFHIRKPGEATSQEIAFFALRSWLGAWTRRLEGAMADCVGAVRRAVRHALSQLILRPSRYG